MEPGKARVHLPQELQAIVALPAELLQHAAEGEPAWDEMAALHPTEHPGNGPQILNGPRSGSAGRTGANVKRTDDLNRRGLLEVGQEVRILMAEPPVALVGEIGRASG